MSPRAPIPDEQFERELARSFAYFLRTLSNTVQEHAKAKRNIFPMVEDAVKSLKVQMEIILARPMDSLPVQMLPKMEPGEVPDVIAAPPRAPNAKGDA